MCVVSHGTRKEERKYGTGGKWKQHARMSFDNEKNGYSVEYTPGQSVCSEKHERQHSATDIKNAVNHRVTHGITGADC
jgi:hypothetical protein